MRQQSGWRREMESLIGLRGRWKDQRLIGQTTEGTTTEGMATNPTRIIIRTINITTTPNNRVALLRSTTTINNNNSRLINLTITCSCRLLLLSSQLAVQEGMDLLLQVALRVVSGCISHIAETPTRLGMIITFRHMLNKFCLITRLSKRTLKL